jgi:hypothetical protein
VWQEFKDSELSTSRRSEERIWDIHEVQSAKEVYPWSQPWSLEEDPVCVSKVVSGDRKDPRSHSDLVP